MLRYLRKTTHARIFHVLVLLAILYLILLGKPYLYPEGEGFASDVDKFVVKRNGDMYDQYYAGMYNKIHEPQPLAEAVSEFILSFTQANPRRSMMLDAGCGTGEQMAYIQNRGFTIYGIDQSTDMVEYALAAHPDLRIKVGDVQKPMMYERATFTHILCTGLHNVLYMTQDKSTFFRNCFHWLVPNGYLVLQLADREQFDPIPPSGKSAVLEAPQKAATERITDTEIQFVDFLYKSTFDFSKKNQVVVSETFVDGKTKGVRKNEATLYMEDVEQILLLARTCGFLVHGQTNLMEHGDEHQYIYLLERPN